MPNWRSRRSLSVAALLVADERDRAAVELADARRRSRRRRPGRGRRAARPSRRGSARRSRACTAGRGAAPARRTPRSRPRWRRLARDRVELAREPLLLAARRPCGAGAAGLAACSSRSRSPRSASPGKEPEEPRQVRALLGSGDDGVDLAEAQVLLGAPEVVGELLLEISCTTRGPVNASSAPGSAIVTSPSDAKLAMRAAGRRVR